MFIQDLSHTYNKIQDVTGGTRNHDSSNIKFSAPKTFPLNVDMLPATPCRISQADLNIAFSVYIGVSDCIDCSSMEVKVCITHVNCNLCSIRLKQCMYRNKLLFRIFSFLYHMFVTQVHEYVKIPNNRTCFRAQKSFRGKTRHDCVRLRNHLTTRDGDTYTFSRLMWIVTGIGVDPLCVGVPLMKAKTFCAKNNAQAELGKEMILLQQCNTKLVMFPCSELERLEQILFVGMSSEYCIVNRFFHSTIFSTTCFDTLVQSPPEQDSSDSDD